MISTYNKEINFFQKIKKSHENKRYIKIVFITIYVFSILIAIFLYSFENIQKNLYVNLINNYNDMLAKEKLIIIEENKYTLEKLIQRSELYKYLKNMYDEQNFLSVQLIEEVSYLQPLDIIIDRFSYKNGVITMNCSSQRIEEGAAFSKRLSDNQYFNEIIYTGVTRVGDEDRYAYTIQIHIGDGAGD